jgi:L-ascorbate metabolism protein UlaG (beta-lactamase superfamily)
MEAIMSVSVTWLGHGAFALQIGGYDVLLDPFLSGNPTASSDPGSLPADFILVSHGHGDHVGDTAAIAKRTGAKIITNNEIAIWFRGQGFDAHGQHIGGGHQHPFGYVKLTIAHHGSGLPDGSYGGNPAGFLIKTDDGTTLYFACDTALFYDMKFIGEEGIDAAFLPIGDNFTMGPDDALKAVKLLEPKVVVPVHFNTWDVIAQDGAAWVKRVNEETDAEGVLLNPGETLEVS